MKPLLAAVVAIAIAGSASAQTPDSDPPSPPSSRSAVADDDLGEAPAVRRYDPMRIVCRRTRPPTGTRVITRGRDSRICLSMEEWDRRAEEAQSVFDEANRGACTTNSCGVGGPG